MSDFIRKLLYAIREGHFDTRGQRGQVIDPNFPGYLGLPEGTRKTAKKLFDCEEEAGKRADSCIHGQGITIFARDRPQLYRRAKTKEPINQFSAVLFSQ